jgi:hypothetical protein
MASFGRFISKAGKQITSDDGLKLLSRYGFGVYAGVETYKSYQARDYERGLVSSSLGILAMHMGAHKIRCLEFACNQAGISFSILACFNMIGLTTTKSR